MKPVKACRACGKTEFRRKSVGWPVPLAGKTVVVGRVAAVECASCGKLAPTKAGEEKISRALGAMQSLGFFAR